MTASATRHGYLVQLDAELADLDPDDRAELVAPIDQRLAELPPDVDPVELFGEPAQLAEDLRAAAGVRGTAPAARRTVIDWLRAGLDRPGPAAVLGYLASLRPAWWAARGFLLFGGLLAALDSNAYHMHTPGYYREAFQDYGHVHLTRLWALLPLAFVVSSIVLGLRTQRLPEPARFAVFALDAAAVVVLLMYPTWWMGPAFAYFNSVAN